MSTGTIRVEPATHRVGERELAGPARRHTDRRSIADRRRDDRPARPRVEGIVAAHHSGDDRRIGDGAGEHGRAVEGPHRGEHTAGAHRPDRRLDADDPVQRRRHAARAGGVGAQRERHQPEGHGDCRAGARTTRYEQRIEHVRRRPVRRAGPDETGGELVEVGLADHDRAGGAHPGHHNGVDGGHEGSTRAGHRRRHTVDVDVVLDHERHAVQRQRLRVDVT